RLFETPHVDLPLIGDIDGENDMPQVIGVRRKPWNALARHPPQHTVASQDAMLQSERFTIGDGVEHAGGYKSLIFRMDGLHPSPLPDLVGACAGETREEPGSKTDSRQSNRRPAP